MLPSPTPSHGIAHLSRPTSLQGRGVGHGTETCPRCGEPALPTTSGRWVSPTPHALGIHDRLTGGLLTRAQVVELVRSTGLAGHRVHVCPTGQATLFGSAGGGA